MKLSEAIRLGAMLKPQGFNSLLYDGRTCAIGAAMDAAGFLGDVKTGSIHGWILAMHAQWPWFGPMQRLCPACEKSHQSDSVEALVIHLNDAHRWSREAIADWVETIEPAEPITVQPEPAEITA